ncbi:threonine-phosphate decarboxylase [Hahella sp. CCB-MM4]|nr:threonine-phosphate decarboxylase [Hahella sp. CCB-MM4]
MLHGGDIFTASRRYGIPVNQWIDLSTGINPDPYPVRDIPSTAFQSLPYESPEFLEQASAYYGNASLLPVCGTQMAIQALPYCLPSAPVLIPEIGYQEHAAQWIKSGAEVSRYPSFDVQVCRRWIEQRINENSRCHLVIINPNNPTGLRFSPEQLKQWAERLDQGGFLIVDEAFMDLTPGDSVLSHHFSSNMIVLRSFGKFFGLAGLRLGFVFAQEAILRRLREHCGVWTVNGPAQAIAAEAFADTAWQQNARERIAIAAEYTESLMRPIVDRMEPLQRIREGLFSSYLVKTDVALEAQNFLAQKGILVRVVDVDESYSLLRTGLLNPEHMHKCQRVEQAASTFTLSFEEDRR